jgi:hypothetical protein
MKRRRFLSVVPKAVQSWALAVGVCVALIGLGVAFHGAHHGTGLRAMLMYGSAGLFGGVATATWILCLGFVYADARERAMRAALWVLVAALFPHLLGFLLYFVMRHPIPSTCSHCGRPITVLQPFCAWCGNPQPPSNTGDAPLGPDSSGLQSV